MSLLEERVKAVRKAVQDLADYAEERDIPWATAGAQELQFGIQKWFPTMGMEPAWEAEPRD